MIDGVLLGGHGSACLFRLLLQLLKLCAVVLSLCAVAVFALAPGRLLLLFCGGIFCAVFSFVVVFNHMFIGSRADIARSLP